MNDIINIHMSKPTRILIVEDREADVDLAIHEIRKFIKDCKFQCVESQEDYLEALERFQPDLILSDYRLPHFDGMTALHLALRHSPLTPLIIWTGSLNEEIAVDCMKAGANNYVIKENRVRLGPAILHALEETQLRLEHKRAKEALEQSEKRFRALIENGLDNISLLAADGTLLWESPAIFRSLDYAPGEFLGQDIFQLMHLDDQGWTRDLFAQLVKEPGSRQRGSFRLRHSNGTWRWVEAVVTNMLHEPSVNAVVVNYRDITERKQMEEMLRRNEAILAQAEKMAHLGAWEIEYNNYEDLNDNPLHWSEEVYRIFGYEPGEVEVTNELFFQHVHPQDRQLVLEAVAHAMAEKRPYEIEHRLIRRDGKERVVREYASINFHEDGQPIQMLGAVQDITERKQAEKALLESEQRYRALFEDTPVAIWEEDFSQVKRHLSSLKQQGVTDFHAYFTTHPEAVSECGAMIKILDVNNTAVQMFQAASKAELIESTDQGLSKGEIEHLPEVFRDIANGKNSNRWEGEDETLKGKPIEISLNWSVAPSYEDDYSKVIVTTLDISERKQAEAQINDLLAFNEKILNTSPVGILTYKMTGECVFANQNAASILGTSVENLEAQNFYFIESWKKSGLYNLIEKAITSGVPVTAEIYQPDTFGKDLWLTAYAVTFKSKEEDHLLLTILDVTERKRADLERQVLLEIMQGLANTQDLQDFLRLIHGSIARVIYAENFLVILYNEHNGLFEEIYSVDQYDPPAPPSRLEKSVTSYVFRTGEPLLLTEARFDELLAEGKVQLVGTNSPSWLGAPLKSSGRTIGVIAVQDYEKPNRYTDHDKDFLASIAAQVALAIERKRAEEDVHAAEAKYRTLVEHIAAITYIAACDEAKTLLYVSPQIETLLGFTQLEYLTDPEMWRNLLHPDDRERVIAEAKRFYESGEPFISEYRSMTRDGRVLWFHDEAIIFREEKGDKSFIQGVKMDITERKQAEESLRDAEEKYRDLVERLPIVIYTSELGIDGVWSYVSPQLEELLGFTPQEWMTDPGLWYRQLHPEDRDRHEKLEEDAHAMGRPFESEYRIFTKDGRQLWIRDSAQILPPQNGGAPIIQGALMDVTRRKQAEAERERLSNILETSLNEIYIFDAETLKFQYVNAGAQRNLGYSFEQLATLTPLDLKPEFSAALFHELLAPLLRREQEIIVFETVHRRANDSLYPVEVHLQFVEQDGERIFLAIISDITERKKVEEESRRHAEETAALLATSLALTNLDLQATLQTIGHSANTLFAADGCRIFLMEPEGEFLQCVLALQENSTAFSGFRIKLGEGVTGAVAASGQAEIVNKMQNDPRGVQVAGTPEEVEAIMFAPLKERNHTIGVLSIRRAGDERPFQLADLELLEAFAAMAASAVSKAHLFEETQHRLAELEALYENGLAVGRLLKPNEIGDRIIETFAHYLSWHHVAIRLKRPESDDLELIALNQPGLNEKQRAAMERHFNSRISKVDQGLSGWVMKTGEPVRTGNVHSHPQYVVTQEGIQSGLYMPLKVGDRIIGSISVESEVAEAFSPQDERLLATLANQAAIAFENARLYQAAQQELAERKRLQEELNREHAQLKTLFETIPNPIWLKDAHGRYLACNPVLEQFVGVPEAEILGKTEYDLFEEKQAQAFEEKDQEAIHSNAPITYQEWVTYPNKQPKLMETVRTPMHDDKGNLIGVLGISHDITAMYIAQQELRESQELYRLLVETSPDGITILGLDGTIIFANQQLADLFGMNGSLDCIGTNFLSLIAPGEHPRLTELVEEANADAVVFEEYWMVRKNSSRFYGEVRSSLSLDKAGQPRWIIGQIRDITESKTAQETIQEERQRFLDLFENTPVAIWLEDFSGVMAWMEQLRIKGVTNLKDYLNRNPDQLQFALGLIRILSVNQAAVEMNGAHSKAELLERFPALIRDQALSSIMLHELEMLWIGKTSFEFEMTSRRFDDTLISGILHVYVPIKNGRPDYARVIIASTDITERVNTEKALQASETHYRELADSITDVFFEMDRDLNYIYWNKASEHLTGISAKDAIGKSMREIFGDTEEQTRIEKVYEAVLRSQRSKTFEATFNLENRQHIFEINAYPSTRGVSVVAKDVTDRKKSEIIMRKRFELMEYSANHSLGELMQQTIDEVSQLTGSTIGFLHFVEGDQITLGMQTWSTSALQQFNVPIGEGGHRSIDQAGVWAEAVRARRSILHNDYASLQNKKGLPEGHVEILREMVIPIIRNEKTVAVLGLGNRPKDYTQRDLEIAERFADYAWDVTERKQMEVALAEERNQLARRVEERAADLIRANTNLARALRVKDEFLANMSHELRTPLNAILGLSESLSEQIAGPLNEKQQKYIATISESGRHLLALINDILDLAKIEAGQITLDINRVDIQSVCEASLRMVRQLAQKKRQDVTLEIDDDIGLIWADERRLKQMIVNLLSNAVKFTPEEGKIGLEVQRNEAENEVMITVWDNGIGMKEEDLSRLFQPFVQLDSGLARETTGTGLGLALVAQMVRLHGGSVRVSSQPEQGSHFTIVLPWEPALAMDPTTKMKVTGKFRAVRPDPHNRSTILLIEDTDEVIMMIRDYLELAGYKVVTAKDGVEGITQAQLIHPDLILMDVMMPRMDGLEATRRLRSEPEFEETPIIALTALAMPSDRERCINAGMNDYMSKPVNLKELVKTIQRFLVKEEANSQ